MSSPSQASRYQSNMSDLAKEPTLHDDSSFPLPGRTYTARTSDAERFGESAAHNEKLYLSPDHLVAGNLKRMLGNPTPIALAGFLLANTPAAIDMMGWGGAGGSTGNSAAGVATYYFSGGLLLVFGGFGEWILGNTYPAALFFFLGGFWLSTGGTDTPSFGAASSYDDIGAYYSSYAFYYIIMALLMLIFTICALRISVCLFVTLGLAVPTFVFLAIADFELGNGNVSAARTMTKIGGGFLFAVCVGVFYLFLGALFESVDFPLSLPVGDLSTRFLGRAERVKRTIEGRGETRDV